MNSGGRTTRQLTALTVALDNDILFITESYKMFITESYKQNKKVF